MKFRNLKTVNIFSRKSVFLSEYAREEQGILSGRINGLKDEII